MNFRASMSTTDRIDYLARWVILNSIIYYNFDYNIVDDKTYDKNSKLLAMMIQHNPQEAQHCYYWDVIHDFDGTTGFDLRDRLTQEHRDYLARIAYNTIRSYKGLI